jgi:hypothetical protein
MFPQDAAHVAEVLGVPEMTAVNRSVAPASMVAEAGVIDI